MFDLIAKWQLWKEAKYVHSLYFLSHWSPSQAIQQHPWTSGTSSMFQDYLIALQMTLKLTQVESVLCAIKSASSGPWAASFGPRQRSYWAMFPRGAVTSPPPPRGAGVNTAYTAAALPLWGLHRPQCPYTGIPCFRALYFVLFHRCTFLKIEEKTLHQRDYDPLYWGGLELNTQHLKYAGSTEVTYFQ